MHANKLLILAAGMSCACSSDGGNECANPANYSPQISAANFPATPKVDNKFFPLVPGTTFRYQDLDGNITETAVTSDTKSVMGIQNVVVHDVVRSALGEVLEDTFDWYAQDNDGAVWYFGEDTREYQSGHVVSTEGSWTAGVDGAKPGIIMPASPAIGASYRQEYLCGVAEDRADVLSLSESITVPYGAFENCLMTKDYSDLEPGTVEHKYYCAGVGQVSAVEIVTVGTGGREDLVSVSRGP